MIIKDVNLETVCAGEDFLTARKDPDDQFLPYQRRVLLRRSAGVRLRARERRGQGKVGQDD